MHHNSIVASIVAKYLGSLDAYAAHARSEHLHVPGPERFTKASACTKETHVRET